MDQREQIRGDEKSLVTLDDEMVYLVSGKVISSSYRLSSFPLVHPPSHGLGFQSTIVLSSNPAITLLFFQLFRRLFLRGKSRETPSPLQAFCLAGLSNSIGQLIRYSCTNYT